MRKIYVVLTDHADKWEVINPKGMDETKIYIYTKDDMIVKKFRFHDSNRKIYQTQVKKLVSRICEHDKFLPPLLIDSKTFLVADGQHRLEAYKKLWEQGYNVKLKVQYQDFGSLEVFENEIRGLQESKSWTTKDNIEQACKHKSSGTKMIHDFCLMDEHPLLHKIKKDGTKTSIMRYATALIFGRNVTNEIKNNNVTVSKEELEYANQTYKEIELILKTLNMGDNIGGWMENCFTAWYRVRHDKLYIKAFDRIGLDVFLAEIGGTDSFKTKDPNLGLNGWEEAFKNAINDIDDIYD